MLKQEIKPFVRLVLHTKLKGTQDLDVINNILFSVDSRLIYIVSGSGKMIIENQSYDLFPGTVVMFKAGTKYMWQPNDICYYIVNFDFNNVNSHITKSIHPISAKLFDSNLIVDSVYFDDEPLLNKPIVIYDNMLSEFFKTLYSEYTFAGEDCDLLLTNLMTTIIFKILRTKKECSNAKSPTSAILRAIILYVDSNYSTQFHISDIAQELGYHPAYINRVFKKHTGKSIRDYVLEFRLNTSIELLSTLDVSLAELSALCGFTNYHYFSRCFKQKFGVSPIKWKSKTHHI